MDLRAIEKSIMGAYEEELRLRIETPIFATAAQKDWVRRRTHRLFVGDWDMLVAPRWTRTARRWRRLRDRWAAARAAWRNPDRADW